VQEAQRQGLDREPAFMRTIERFWKEALIKLLLSHKAQEIAGKVHVYEPDIEAYYERLSQETQARIVRVSDEPSARRLAQEPELDVTLAELGSALLDDSGWQWYAVGRLDPVLESALFETLPGERSAPILFQGRWLVVAVAERRPRTIEPLSVLREEIHRTLRQQQEAESMEQWIGELKARARIEIDQQALAQLQ
jgi:parvulin-like peptidyl-prolyl isomerase